MTDPARSTRASTAMTPPSTLRVHGALFTVGALFSANYIISKLGMREFAPMSFAWLRVAGSAIVLYLVLPRNRQPFARADLRSVTLFSILGVVINQSLFLGGLALTSAHVAAILITTIPVFALAAAIVSGSERATRAKIAGIALAGAGALLVVTGEGFEGSPRSVAGAVMIVLNCLSYATYLVVSKPAMSRLPPLEVVARMFSIGAVLMLPLAAWPLAHERWSAIPPRAWLALALVIIGPTTLAYVINAWTLRHAESSLVAAYTYVQPVLTTVLAALFLGEEIRGIVAIAALLIFSGVALAAKRNAIPESS